MGNMIGSGVFLLPASLAPYRRHQPGRLARVRRRARAAGARVRAARRDSIPPPAARTPTRGARSATSPGFSSPGATGSRCGTDAARWRWRSSATSIRSSRRSSGRPPPRRSLAVATLWLLTLVNVVGVRAAGRVQVVTTVLKILPLAVRRHRRAVRAFDAGAFRDRADRARARSPTASSATATLTLWAFLGLECATIPGGGDRDPGADDPARDDRRARCSPPSSTSSAPSA